MLLPNSPERNEGPRGAETQERRRRRKRREPVVRPESNAEALLIMTLTGELTTSNC